MMLTGHEVMTVPDYQRGSRRKALKDMTQLDVLAVANEATRLHQAELAEALYQWQWRMRQPKPKGGPRHAA